MKRFLLTMLGFSLVVSAIAQAPDPPISPAQAVSMLGKGILLEPEAGNVKLGFSAKYKPAYGDTIKKAGFQSVRIRYQGSNNPMMEAIASGPPYGPKVDSLLDQTDSIMTDLLNKNLHTPIRIPLHFPSGFYIGEIIFHNSKTEFKLVKQ